MGTFKITTPTAIGSKSGAQFVRALNNNQGDVDLIAGLLGDMNAGDGFEFGAILAGNIAISGTVRFQFDHGSNIISLDGNAPISFNALPGGFTPTSATISFLYQLIQAAGTTSIFIQLDPLTESPAFSVPDSILPMSLAYNFNTFPQPKMLDIINNGFGIRASFGNNNDFVDAANFLFTGTYAIQNSQYTIPIGSVYVGDKIKITGPGLDGVAQVQLTFTDANGPQTIIVPPWDIILQQSTQLWFYVPYGFFSFPIDQTPKTATITLLGNGVQFSGSVVAGTITVLFSDASGIYVLTETQTNDILYFRAGYTVTIAQPILTDILFMEQNEIYETDPFDLMKYPWKVLAQNYLDDDYDYDYDGEDMFLTLNTQIFVIPISVEIPSPFIETSFIP